MAYLWNDSLTLGIDRLDDQHRQLLDLASSLPDNPQEGLEPAIDTLLQYTFEHFTAEEIYMQEQEYPELDEHARIHQRFAGRFDSYFRAYLQHDIDCQSFCDFVVQWVEEHIYGVDKRFADWLQQR